MTLSAGALQAVFAQSTDKAFLALLTIAHPDLSPTIRVVCDGQNLVSRGNSFIAYPFVIQLPDQDPEQPPQPKIVIDNVAQDIIVGIRTLTSAPTVTLEVVMHTTPDTVEAGPFVMSLLAVDYDALTITGTLGFEDILNEPFPGDSYTPANFPGLF